MDAGGLAQMSHSAFNQANGLAMPTSGLASRRGGGQNIKPLSFDSLKAPAGDKDNGVPTPRTSRSHLLAGLRTAPKSSTATSFPNHPQSPTVAAPQARNNRNSMGSGMYENANLYSGPKTSMPRYGTGQKQQAYNQAMSFGQQYTVEQILAPPQIQVEENIQEQLDPNVQAQLMMANAYLSEQQQRLQLQLRTLQAAAQQFQGLNLNGQSQLQQSYAANLYQQQQVQQQQLQAMKAIMGANGLNGQQQQLYMAYDPVTGQQTIYIDQSQQNQQAQLQAQLAAQQAQLSQAQLNQSQFTQSQYNQYQDLQYQQQQQTPVVQVSPPQENAKPYRNNSPSRRYESPIENVVPLPPPSANAFRRGHKKSSSTANRNSLSIATDELRSAGPKTATFPLTPLTAGYGPGQARAGEHPVRQPRNPPSLDELKALPTAKHEGSKNFVTRTRRSALNNLVRAGLERRKEARSSGSISPISESTEELVETPLTDNDSDSGRSGSGSLVGDDAECSLPSSRTSTGSWGAIGSDRPSSRQQKSNSNARGSVDSTTSSASASDNERPIVGGSFASLLKYSSSDVKSEPNGRAMAMLVLASGKELKAN